LSTPQPARAGLHGNIADKLIGFLFDSLWRRLHVSAVDYGFETSTEASEHAHPLRIPHGFLVAGHSTDQAPD
jgi:hypothetical protein